MSDLISRQAAIYKVDCLYRDTKNDESYMITGYNHALSDMRAILKSLPSAEPERKNGEWRKRPGKVVSDDGMWGEVLYACSNCRHEKHVPTNYCSYCGADMRQNSIEYPLKIVWAETRGEQNEHTD